MGRRGLAKSHVALFLERPWLPAAAARARAPETADNVPRGTSVQILVDSSWRWPPKPLFGTWKNIRGTNLSVQPVGPLGLGKVRFPTPLTPPAADSAQHTPMCMSRPTPHQAAGLSPTAPPQWIALRF